MAVSEIKKALEDPVPIANGGTGSTAAADARTALGLGNLATLNSPLAVNKGGSGMTAVQTTSVTGTGLTCYLRKWGPVVVARLEGALSSDVTTSTVIMTFPDGYKPIAGIFFVSGNAKVDVCDNFALNTSGQIKPLHSIGSGAKERTSFSYFVL